MKRYDPAYFDQSGEYPTNYPTMEEDVIGDYVKYDDHIKRIEKILDRVIELESERIDNTELRDILSHAKIHKNHFRSNTFVNSEYNMTRIMIDVERNDSYELLDILNYIGGNKNE